MKKFKLFLKLRFLAIRSFSLRFFIAEKLGMVKLQEELEIQRRLICNATDELIYYKGKNETLESEYKALNGHVRFLNENFFVAADLGGSHDVTVITILQRGKNPVIKYFNLGNNDVMTVNKFLENFTEKNVKIDAPSFYPIKPNFRF